MTIIERPSEFQDLRPSSWKETSIPNVIRTSMEDQTVKVRRRSTGIIRRAVATYIIDADQRPIWEDWFFTDCMSGVYPTRLIQGDDTVGVWRFVGNPTFEYNEFDVFIISVELEQLPGWVS